MLLQPWSLCPVDAKDLEDEWSVVQQARSFLMEEVDAATVGRQVMQFSDTPKTGSFHLEFVFSRIWLKSTKSGPVGFEKIDFSHFSPCSMQWMFQTPGVSIVHVQKTVSYNNV